MTSTTTRLSVEDRLDIIELTARYSYHIDRYELEPLLELWTEDAVFDERPLGLYYAVGIDKIREFFEHDYKVSSAHVHYMTNHILEAVSETEARGTCCGLVQADLHNGAVIHATVNYTDEYVKRDGRWLFKSRVVRPFCKIDLGAISTALDEQIAGAVDKE